MVRDPASKILTLAQAAEWRAALRRSDAELVIVNGCFDLLHPGHCRYLNRARREGDALLVLVNGDASVRALKGPARPVNAELDRAYVLASLRAVDAVVVFGPATDCSAELALLRPDIYCQAAPRTLETLDLRERAALDQAGSRIVFLPATPGMSSTRLIELCRGAAPGPAGDEAASGGPKGRVPSGHPEGLPPLSRRQSPEGSGEASRPGQGSGPQALSIDSLSGGTGG